MPILNSCTFCEWGSAALNKIRQFPLDRVLGDIDWFGFNKVEYLECCDANFGILARDEQIVEAMVRAKEKYGYPKKFRAAFAKYSNTQISERIFRIASTLNKSGQLKAVTMALQSTDDGVLEAIDRKNISMSGFAQLQERYRQHGIPTYIELIIALPGETYASFKAGLDRVLDAGGHTGLSTYLCVLLPNSEMSHPDYIKKHGIQSVDMRAMLLHGTPSKDFPDEIQPTVIATNTMSYEDWQKAFMLSWTIQVLHSLGLTQWWAIQERQGGLAYTRFYEGMGDLAKAYPDTVWGRAWAHTHNLLLQAVAGGSWDNVLPDFGEVSWPPDEGGFLLIVKKHGIFYDEMVNLAGMPAEQIERGPPPIPTGGEVGYSQALWYGKRGDTMKALRDFCAD